MKVYVAVHHNGENDTTEHMRVFADKAKAIAWRREIARDDWPSQLGERPDDVDQMADEYWDFVGLREDAWFLWDECEVEP